VIGSPAAAEEWYFAEGYTGEGFQEYLCLQNPGNAAAIVELTCYAQEQGALPPGSLTVPAHTRITVYLNQYAGEDLQVSCRLRVTAGPPIVAERPMYFSYFGQAGGHTALGYRP
jgi:hypothetical protein